jgi:hypothetical protein
MRKVLYRADRVGRPHTLLPSAPIRSDAGWCDALWDRNYNRPIRHPYPASAEHLWRQDGLYDVLVVLGYNDRPRVRGLGSAIFLHVARNAGAPTEGCIAVARTHLLRRCEGRDNNGRVRRDRRARVPDRPGCRPARTLTKLTGPRPFSSTIWAITWAAAQSDMPLPPSEHVERIVGVERALGLRAGDHAGDGDTPRDRADWSGHARVDEQKRRVR